MNRVKKVLTIGIAAALMHIAAVSDASSAEVYLLGGETRSSEPRVDSYAWQFEYRQDLLRYLGAGISYLNEGHLKQHHRDGYTAQLWTRGKMLDNQLVLAAGIGPYFFLDTTSASNPDGFSNDHGWKPMLSLAAAWHMKNNLLLELRSNWVQGPSGFDTTTILAGVGYRFEPVATRQASSDRSQGEEAKNEITLFLGRTIENSFNSQGSPGAGLEYRRHLWRHIDWTLAGLYEGDNHLIKRDGVVTQAWAIQQLLENFSVGAGGGAYLDLNHHDNPGQGISPDRPFSGIATLTGSYRFAADWAVRASWNRVITSYHRDADVILGGIGYLF